MPSNAKEILFYLRK